jgi:uncharacterized protein (DUF1499 family)
MCVTVNASSGEKHMKIGLITLSVLALAVVAAFVFLGIQSRGASAPGVSETSLRACDDKPNCVSSSAPSNSPRYIAAFQFSAGGEDALWAKLVKIVAAEGGELNENSRPYLAATFKSRLFGFIDDFECLLDQDAGVIHVRAGARVGHSDFDVNRKRVEKVRAKLVL